MQRTISFLREFSIPLIGGVIAALLWANLDHRSYHAFLHYPLLGENFKVFGHLFNFYFLINDLFMALFFGIAAVEITQAVGLGGSLNPISKAINPLIGTLGGVLGPIGVFFLLCYVMPLSSLTQGDITLKMVVNGWGIPTATDIALAWLVARTVFGSAHPAVSYLLLLAVADDAVGLGIIAIFYPDPNYPVEVQYLGLTALGMLVAFGLRKMKVKSFWPYVLAAGGLSWLGLILAHLHPALALVFVVPFMPNGKGPHGQLFEDESGHSTLIEFEHFHKLPVEFGLFGFGLANAGVPFAGINQVTWIIFLSLILGKTIGVTLFGYSAQFLGFKLPEGMNFKTLVVAGVIAGLGLTVALFVAGQAYTNMDLQGAAKMGALFSVAAAPVALVLGRMFMIQKKSA